MSTSLLKITSETLSRDLEKEVPEHMVVIAKNSVMGLDDDSICEILGCSGEDLRQVTDSDLYKEIRLYIGGVKAQEQANQAQGWDFIEGEAIRKLAERLPFEKDSEFLLRVAAVANKAQRRQMTQDNILDPTQKNGRTAITLTQRIVSRITKAGQDIVEERQLSIKDGSMGSPSFEEIDSVLHVNRDRVPSAAEIRHHREVPSLEDLDKEMRDSEIKRQP